MGIFIWAHLQAGRLLQLPLRAPSRQFPRKRRLPWLLSNVHFPALGPIPAPATAPTN